MAYEPYKHQSSNDNYDSYKDSYKNNHNNHHNHDNHNYDEYDKHGMYKIYENDEEDYADNIKVIDKFAIDDYFKMYEEEEEIKYFKVKNKETENNKKMTPSYIAGKYKMRIYQSFSFILIICVITAGTIISRYQLYQDYMRNFFATVPYCDITPLNRDYKTLNTMPKSVYDRNMDMYVQAAEEARRNSAAGANVSAETLLKFTQKHQMRYIHQIEDNMPNGCEVVSLAMVLSRYIPDISAHEINSGEYLPKKPLPELQNGVYIAEDPTNFYIGSPDGAGYGIFAPGLAKAAVNTINAYKLDKTVTDISGCTEEELFKYVSDGYPVIIWHTIQLKPVNWERYYWHLPNGRIYRYPQNQHCSVLVEHTESTVTLYDPKSGIVEYDRALFLQRWNELGPYPEITRQAVVIK